MAFDQNKYVSEYIRDNIRKYVFKLNRKHHTKIIDWMESQPNKNEYILSLVKEDMTRKGIPFDSEVTE